MVLLTMIGSKANFGSQGIVISVGNVTLNKVISYRYSLLVQKVTE